MYPETPWQRVERLTRELLDAQQELERELGALDQEQAADRPRLRLVEGGAQSAA